MRETLTDEIFVKDNDITYGKLLKNIRGYPNSYDNYWNEHYTPRMYVSLKDLFTFNMNSTRRYHQGKKQISPFVSRKPSSINQKLKLITSNNEDDGHSFSAESPSLLNRTVEQEHELYANHLKTYAEYTDKLEKQLNDFPFKFPIFSDEQSFYYHEFAIEDEEEEDQNRETDTPIESVSQDSTSGSTVGVRIHAIEPSEKRIYQKVIDFEEYKS